jgi:hypothetical protein
VLWPALVLDLDDAREKIEEWRTEYKQVRPHSAIGDRTPMSLIHQLRRPLGASIAGSLSSFIVFPSFCYIFGFSTLLSIVPDAMSAAVMIIAAGMSYCVNDLRWRTVLSGALLLALWLGYIVYSNPSWFIGAGFVFAPLIAFSILDARSAKLSAARIAAFAIAFALLYAVGPLDYIRTLLAHSSRIYFYSEWSRPQDTLYASWVFESPRLLWTYLFFLSGWVVGLIFGDRSERKAAFVCLLLFAVFLVQVSVYLFAPIHCPATLPAYYETLVGPIYAFGSIVGYSSFCWDCLAQAVCGTTFERDGGTIALLTGASTASRAIQERHQSCSGIEWNCIRPREVRRRHYSPREIEILRPHCPKDRL